MDTVLAAAIGGIVSLTVGVIGWLIADASFRAQYGSALGAERVATRLLKNAKWKLRSFGEIKRRLGGFDDNELRQILVRCGAIRFHKNGATVVKEGSDDELWGLYQRNKRAVE